jgi:hypothetical protein
VNAAQNVERDPVAGVWNAYHPVGGAITLLDKVEPRGQLEETGPKKGGKPSYGGQLL